ncbi:hypothetical protein MWG58_31210 (plasmid) [Streptomyces sp. WAC00276]|uniref:hypothetical protein n=1 Tax=Streptomyces sp. WAC00276 TaxID=2933778 RepID=UPI001FFEC568|nr:hypothetical protein [Streptomyces sp. WAC00276]MCK2145295.1 hypothetical protein [Streptomyces sp. WAC00276]
MLKTWREEYRANQAAKRRIEQEEWEQEKRWREEDRAARLKAVAENAVDPAEHNQNLKAATGVSYLTLVCHEDTWTFMAIRAFGQWKPEWTQSTPHEMHDAGGGSPNYLDSSRFTVDPNLLKGRIKKLPTGTNKAGMQQITLSGHNLTQLLASLHQGAKEEDIADSARCGRLYGKLVEFLDLLDPDAEAGQTTGITFQIDDSVDASHLRQ